jgi:mono/diheme cytochrome c family protein
MRSLVRLAGATVLVLLAVTGIAGQAAAQGAAVVRAGDPQRGREVAEKLCVACHRVSPEQTSGGAAEVPSFPVIANRPGRTVERIMGSILMPHPQMPDTALTNQTLADLAAFIASYKTTD